MNVPAIARKTFEELRNLVEYNSIVNQVLNTLSKKSTPEDRARFTHQSIEDFNQEVFSHPLVKELSPCQQGCSACCHTQVSVTEDEASLLVSRIRSGVEIDRERLDIQMNAQNDPHAFFKLKYSDRRCIFLDEVGSCRVYHDRPAVCRTNAVLGSADQCDTSFAIKPLRLVRTPKADMVIYASFLFSKKSGSLPQMVGELLEAP